MCGDDDEGGGAGGGATNMLTDGDADACEQDCDAQVAPACERTPPDYATSCKLLCQALRNNTPQQCQAALRAQSQCAVDRAQYSCVNGMARVSPAGICAREGAACAACRGSLCIPGF